MLDSDFRTLCDGTVSGRPHERNNARATNTNPSATRGRGAPTRA